MWATVGFFFELVSASGPKHHRDAWTHRNILWHHIGNTPWQCPTGNPTFSEYMPSNLYRKLPLWNNHTDYQIYFCRRCATSNTSAGCFLPGPHFSSWATSAISATILSISISHSDQRGLAGTHFWSKKSMSLPHSCGPLQQEKSPLCSGTLKKLANVTWRMRSRRAN